jgi:hypothetical protein
MLAQQTHVSHFDPRFDTRISDNPSEARQKNLEQLAAQPDVQGQL